MPRASASLAFSESQFSTSSKSLFLVLFHFHWWPWSQPSSLHLSLSAPHHVSSSSNTLSSPWKLFNSVTSFSLCQTMFQEQNTEEIMLWVSYLQEATHCKVISKPQQIICLSQAVFIKLFLWSLGEITLSYKRPWYWERLKLGGEGDDRGEDGWMASMTQWTWVWASPGRWWRIGKPGVLQFMGSQRRGHDWVNRSKFIKQMIWR